MYFKKKSKVKIVFFGSSLIAKEVAKNLLKKKFNIVLIVTQPDKPAGRHRNLKAPPMKELALKKNIPFKQFSCLDKKAIKEILSGKPDLILTCAYGNILPKKLIEAPPLGSLNIHPSLLPDLRGPAPLQTALLKGYKQTGITFMLMDEKMDHGDIISQASIKIKAEDDYNSLEKNIVTEINKALPDVLKKWIKGEIIPKKQEHNKATYTRIIRKSDGLIDWKKEGARIIYNKYRAFVNWPQIYSFWNKGGETAKKITFNKIALALKNNSRPKKFKPGEVFKENGEIKIQSRKGDITIKQLQLEGKPATKAEDFINGYPGFIGAILK